MKRITLSLLTALSAGFIPFSVHAAEDLMVAATMQRCATNEDCALVTNSCNDNCGFVPINKTNIPTLDALYQSRCGKPMSANPACTVNPSMAAACVNARCTIDTAYKNNAGAGDYKSGAYPVPEAPVPSKVQANVTDSKSLTAYSLPQTDVKQNTVGTIITKVYVPASSPVSGGNYVPIGQAAAIPPAAVPTAQSNATPPVPVPSAPVATAPQMIPPPAVPASPTVPAMTPSVEPSIAAPVYVPAPPAVPSAPPIPSVGATGVPQAPMGAKPIPPSDLQPAPTYVPPAGTTSEVSPEDPGAPPPEGTTMTMTPGPDGSKGMTTAPTTKTKSFGTVSGKTKASDNFN